MNEIEQNPSILIGGMPSEPIQTEVRGTPLAILPPGWMVAEQHHLLLNPLRIARHEAFTDLVSWMDYVNRFKRPGSVVFANLSASRIETTAVLDYHDADAPHWCDHQAKFAAQQTPAWSAWAGYNEKLMRQSEFADFLYLNQKEVKQPDGAQLLEIIQTLKATAAGEFREMRDDFTGSSELIYRMKVSSQGGTTENPLSLPRQFQVSVVPFYGCPALLLQADIRVCTPAKDGDPLLLGYRFYRLADELNGLAEAAIKLIGDSTGLPVWR